MGPLAHREAMFGKHWLCIFDFNPTISRLNIFNLMLFQDKAHPEEYVLRGE